MYPLPPLAELRAFEAAARHLSFKEAATELGVDAHRYQLRLLDVFGVAGFRAVVPFLGIVPDGGSFLTAVRSPMGSSRRRP